MTIFRGVDLEALFEPRVLPTAFENEVEAVCAGEKAISFTPFDQDAFEYVEFAEMTDAALAGGLQVSIRETVRPEVAIRWRDVYLHRPEEAWRIPALRVVDSLMAEYRWSDGLEALYSRLLGYTEEQLSSWLAWLHRQKVGWAGTTVYVLMSRERQDQLARFGMRCLDPSAVGADTLLFWQRDVVPRLDIDDRIPAELALGRMALTYQMCIELFGPPAERPEGVVTRLLDESLSIKVNQALCSKIEFRAAGTWR